MALHVAKVDPSCAFALHLLYATITRARPSVGLRPPEHSLACTSQITRSRRGRGLVQYYSILPRTAGWHGAAQQGAG